MARLELAKNVWWAKMTYDEQVEYLKGHPRSKLKLTRRRSRKQKTEDQVQPEEEKAPQEEEQPAESTDAKPSEDTAPSGAEDIPVGGEPVPDAEDLPNPPTPEEQQEVTDAVINNEGTVELTDEEKTAGAEALAEQAAPAFEKENLDEKFGDDDKADFEDEFEEILAEEDNDKRVARFLGTALRFAVKAGIITAAIALTGGSPTVLFVPSVMQSIWSTATDWSDRSGSLFDTAADAVHRTFKNGAKAHLKYGVRKPKGEE